MKSTDESDNSRMVMLVVRGKRSKNSIDHREG